MDWPNYDLTEIQKRILHVVQDNSDRILRARIVDACQTKEVLGVEENAKRRHRVTVYRNIEDLLEAQILVEDVVNVPGWKRKKRYLRINWEKRDLKEPDHPLGVFYQ